MPLTGQRESNRSNPIKLKVLSWNVRGVTDSSKSKIIKNFIRNQKVDLLCIQETKIQPMSEGVVRSLGSGLESSGCGGDCGRYLDLLGQKVA